MDLAAIGREPLVLPADEVYAACAPLVAALARGRRAPPRGLRRRKRVAWSEVAGLYVVGGGGLFPLVTRVLKERFGDKRVRRSPHPFAATAMGLAIFLDREAG